MSDEKLQEIVREVQNLSELDHPNIIGFYDFFHDEEKIYIVLEYAPGGDLIGIIPDHESGEETLSEDRISLIFLQILMAVTECHKNYIVHRDIKLDNIVFGTDNVIKLIDFGCSVKCYPGQFITEPLCGTRDYLAPEIIAPSGQYDSRVDIWALGVVLYELITGDSPFSGETPHETRYLISTNQYEIHEKLHGKFYHIIRKIFVPADQRITLNEIFANPAISSQIRLLLCISQGLQKLY